MTAIGKGCGCSVTRNLLNVIVRHRTRRRDRKLSRRDKPGPRPGSRVPAAGMARWVRSHARQSIERRRVVADCQLHLRTYRTDRSIAASTDHHRQISLTQNSYFSLGHTTCHGPTELNACLSIVSTIGFSRRGPKKVS